MATASACDTKPSKWFSNKSFKLSIPRLRSKSKSTSSFSSSLSLTTKSSSTREEELREVFRRFDADNDGKISVEELYSYFVSTGEYSMSLNDVRRVIEEFDNNGDGLLDFQDFVRLMKLEDDGSGDDSDLRVAFEMYEGDKGAGCITPTGLQQMFNKLGEKKTYEECVKMIKVFDLDGNGVLDFHEFQIMMN